MKPFPTAEEAKNKTDWYYVDTQYIVDKHFKKILKKIKKASAKGKYQLEYRPFFKLSFPHGWELYKKLEKLGYIVGMHHGGELFIIYWNIL